MHLFGGVIGIAIGASVTGVLAAPRGIADRATLFTAGQVIFQNSLQTYLAPYNLTESLVLEIRSSVLVLKTLDPAIKAQAVASYVLVGDMAEC